MKTGILISLLFLVLLSSCSSAKFIYDYDKTTDYSIYKTYDYFPQMNSGMSALDTKRLIRSVDASLSLKGLARVKEGQIPDFYVNVSSAVFQEAPSSSIGIGVGGSGSNVGGGVSMGFPISEPGLRRQITIDLVDVAKDALYWQAVGEETYREDRSPEAREEALQKFVDKAFSNYPPKS